MAIRWRLHVDGRAAALDGRVELEGRRQDGFRQRGGRPRRALLDDPFPTQALGDGGRVLAVAQPRERRQRGDGRLLAGTFRDQLVADRGLHLGKGLLLGLVAGGDARHHRILAHSDGRGVVALGQHVRLEQRPAQPRLRERRRAAVAGDSGDRLDGEGERLGDAGQGVWLLEGDLVHLPEQLVERLLGGLPAERQLQPSPGLLEGGRRHVLHFEQGDEVDAELGDHRHRQIAGCQGPKRVRERRDEGVPIGEAQVSAVGGRAWIFRELPGLGGEVRPGLDLLPEAAQALDGLCLGTRLPHLQQDVGATAAAHVGRLQACLLLGVEGHPQCLLGYLLCRHDGREGEPRVVDVKRQRRPIPIELRVVAGRDVLLGHLDRGLEALRRHRQVRDVAALQQHPGRIPNFLLRHDHRVGDASRQLVDPRIRHHLLLVGAGREAGGGEGGAEAILIELAVHLELRVGGDLAAHPCIGDGDVQGIGKLQEQGAVDEAVEGRLPQRGGVDEGWVRVVTHPRQEVAPAPLRLGLQRHLGDLRAIHRGGDGLAHGEQVEGTEAEHRQHDDDEPDQDAGAQRLGTIAHALEHLRHLRLVDAVRPRAPWRPDESVQGVFERLARLEGRRPGSGDLDARAGLRIAPGACRALADIECAEAGQGDGLGVPQGTGNAGQRGVQGSGGGASGEVGLLADVIDEIRFVHACPCGAGRAGRQSRRRGFL